MSLIPMPATVVSAQAEATPIRTLGFGRTEIESFVSVGRSDILSLQAAEVQDDLLRSAILEMAPQTSLSRLVCHLSFRPRGEERFERLLFSISFTAPDATLRDQPIARLLVPRRLTSGPFSIHKGLSVGVKIGVTGLAELHADGEWASDTEQRPCYVIARGESESDPEWDYSSTPDMALDGGHDMGLLALAPGGVRTQVEIRVEGTVRMGRQRTDVTWLLPDHLRRFSLDPAET